LRKGSAYHLDFFVLGVCVLVTGLLGIPPCNGLIPQAPLHTHSLCVYDAQSGVVSKTYEVRYTNFTQALLTGVVCFKPFLTVLGKIPKASLDGLFIFMALSSLGGNELWDRFVLLVSEPALRASKHRYFQQVPFPTIARFTRLQLAAVCLIFVVTLTPLAMAFPLFIAALVYVRTRLLPKHFRGSDLLELDPLIDLNMKAAAVKDVLDKDDEEQQQQQRRGHPQDDDVPRDDDHRHPPPPPQEEEAVDHVEIAVATSSSQEEAPPV